jgi:hypothetical protein
LCKVSKPWSVNCRLKTRFKSPFSSTPDSFLFTGYSVTFKLNKCSCLPRRDPSLMEAYIHATFRSDGSVMWITVLHTNSNI